MGMKSTSPTGKNGKQHGNTKKASTASGRSRTGKGVKKPGF